MVTGNLLQEEEKCGIVRVSNHAGSQEVRILKIVTLMENTAVDPQLHTEPALSMYVEANGKKILFDAGMTENFAENAEKLGVDLAAVDLVILSHGHDDHGGGLPRFLELNQTAPVYINRHAFRPFYARETKDLSIPAMLKDHKQVVITDDYLDLGDGMELFTCNGKEFPYQVRHFGLSTMTGGIHVPDDFRHEQYLLIREGEKKVLFSGCSHKGILNIMSWVECDVLLGGFHFMRLELEGEDRDYLEMSAKKLMEYPTTYYTCHCTGLKQYGFLKERMGDQLRYAAGGQTIEL